jgi:RNase H-fold protein (predicted Holliday junction resolvase)
LSSFAAEEKLAPADLTRGKQKNRLDAVAAAEILEAFLEYKHSAGNAGTEFAHP